MPHNISYIMKRLLFALSMLAFVVSALPQARGADVTVDFIYDNLSGGNWIDVEGYGYGWQPDLGVSDPNWRPYSDGYWAYTDYGWTWIGAPPGSRGELVAITLGGRLCRRAGQASLMKDNPSARTWM